MARIDSAVNRDALRKPRATSIAYSTNEISDPVVSRPATIRLPPTQIASSAAHSPATNETPPSAECATILRRANSTARSL
jgi:hypothetical protein